MNNYDVIVAGSGVAGLYAAINLSKNLRILLVSKAELSLCNSSLAQGGIAGVYKSPNDLSPEVLKTILKQQVFWSMKLILILTG